VCAVVVVLSALPVFAAGQIEGKDECLVYSKNCSDSVDSLPERIAKLKVEIGKGETVYTSEELMQLECKLKGNNELIRVMHKP
ncbi:MAG: hypothetical protein PHH28_08930, partial [Desulfuromonadaceae bacterium]|nr:hypothetical protein [Desulfuromonadaceae bacterium]